jgi:hypothetical protein
MLILFVILLVGGLALNEIIRHMLPSTYAVLDAVSWATEGILVVLMAAGLVYQYFVGHLP